MQINNFPTTARNLWHLYGKDNVRITTETSRDNLRVAKRQNPGSYIQRQTLGSMVRDTKS